MGISDIFDSIKEKYAELSESVKEKYNFDLPSFGMVVFLLVLLVSAIIYIAVGSQPVLEKGFGVSVSSGTEKVENARVELYNQNNELVDVSSTDAKGTVRFDNLEPGKAYTLKISKDGFKPAEKSITVGKNKLFSVSLEAPTAELTSAVIRIFDTAAKAVGEVSIRYSYENGGKVSSSDVKTNTAGIAKIRVAKGASVTLKITKENYEAKTYLFIATGNGTQEIVIKPIKGTGNAIGGISFENEGSVRVLVQGKENGKVISGAIVKLIDSATKDSLGSKDTVLGIAIFEGISIGRSVFVTVEADGFAGATSEERKTISETLVSFKLEKGEAEKTTSVCLEDDGKEVSNTKVMLISATYFNIVTEGMTQENGCASFEGLEKGKSYYALGLSNDYLVARSDAFKAGETKKIAMEKWTKENSARLKATIIDAEGKTIKNASVALFDGDNGNYLTYIPQRTNGFGIAEFTNLKKGKAYAIRASYKDMAAEWEYVPSNETEELTLQFPQQFATELMTIYDAETNASVMNAKGFAYSINASAGDGASADAGAETYYETCSGSTCELKVNANSGKNRIVVKANGYLQYSFDGGILKEGEQKEESVALQPASDAKFIEKMTILNYDAVKGSEAGTADKLSFGGSCISAEILWKDGTNRTGEINAIEFSGTYGITSDGIISTDGRVKILDDGCGEGMQISKITILGFDDPLYGVKEKVSQTAGAVSFGDSNGEYCADLEIETTDGSKSGIVATKLAFDGIFSYSNETGEIEVNSGTVKIYNDNCNAADSVPNVGVQLTGLFDENGNRSSKMEVGQVYTAKIALTVSNSLRGGIYLRTGNATEDSAEIAELVTGTYNDFVGAGKTYDESNLHECGIQSTITEKPFKWVEAKSNFRKEGETKETQIKIRARATSTYESATLFLRGYAEKFGKYYRAPYDEELGTGTNSTNKTGCFAKTVSAKYNVEELPNSICNDEGCVSVQFSQPPNKEKTDGLSSKKFHANSVQDCVSGSRIIAECADGLLQMDYQVKLFRKGTTFTQLSFEVGTQFGNSPDAIDLSSANENDVVSGTVLLRPITSTRNARVALILENDAPNSEKLTYETAIAIDYYGVNTPRSSILNLTEDSCNGKVKLTYNGKINSNDRLMLSCKALDLVVDAVMPADSVPLELESTGDCEILTRFSEDTGMDVPSKGCYTGSIMDSRLSNSGNYSIEYDASSSNPSCSDEFRLKGNSIKQSRGKLTFHPVCDPSGDSDKNLTVNVHVLPFKGLYVAPVYMNPIYTVKNGASFKVDNGQALWAVTNLEQYGKRDIEVRSTENGVQKKSILAHFDGPGTKLFVFGGNDETDMKVDFLEGGVSVFENDVDPTSSNYNEEWIVPSTVTRTLGRMEQGDIPASLPEEIAVQMKQKSEWDSGLVAKTIEKGKTLASATAYRRSNDFVLWCEYNLECRGNYEGEGCCKSSLDDWRNLTAQYAETAVACDGTTQNGIPKKFCNDVYAKTYGEAGTETPKFDCDSRCINGVATIANGETYDGKVCSTTDASAPFCDYQCTNNCGSPNCDLGCDSEGMEITKGEYSLTQDENVPWINKTEVIPVNMGWELIEDKNLPLSDFSSTPKFTYSFVTNTESKAYESFDDGYEYLQEGNEKCDHQLGIYEIRLSNEKGIGGTAAATESSVTASSTGTTGSAGSATGSTTGTSGSGIETITTSAVSSPDGWNADANALTVDANAYVGMDCYKKRETKLCYYVYWDYAPELKSKCINSISTQIPELKDFAYAGSYNYYGAAVDGTGDKPDEKGDSTQYYQITPKGWVVHFKERVPRQGTTGDTAKQGMLFEVWSPLGEKKEYTIRFGGNYFQDTVVGKIVAAYATQLATSFIGNMLGGAMGDSMSKAGPAAAATGKAACTITSNALGYGLMGAMGVQPGGFTGAMGTGAISGAIQAATNYADSQSKQGITQAGGTQTTAVSANNNDLNKEYGLTQGSDGKVTTTINGKVVEVKSVTTGTKVQATGFDEQTHLATGEEVKTQYVVDKDNNIYSKGTTGYTKTTDQTTVTLSDGSTYLGPTNTMPTKLATASWYARPGYSFAMPIATGLSQILFLSPSALKKMNGNCQTLDSVNAEGKEITPDAEICAMPGAGKGSALSSAAGAAGGAAGGVLGSMGNDAVGRAWNSGGSQVAGTAGSAGVGSSVGGITGTIGRIGAGNDKCGTSQSNLLGAAGGVVGQEMASSIVSGQSPNWYGEHEIPGDWMLTCSDGANNFDNGDVQSCVRDKEVQQPNVERKI